MVFENPEPSPEIKEAEDQALAWAQTYVEAARLAADEDYAEAADLIEDSELPPQIQEQLLGALRTGERPLISALFREYTGRLGTAFCAGCWGETDG